MFLNSVAPVFLTLGAMLSALNATAQERAPVQNADENVGEENTITVVRDRLRRAGGVIGIGLFGKMSCKVTNPSGDENIDTAACEIALDCARQNRRSRDREQFTACVEEGYDAFVDTYRSEQ